MTRAFTLIELLAVIAIIVLVMAMAIPNFAAMMRAQKWQAAIGSLQMIITRARALATEIRVDIAVEFEINNEDPRNSWTRMWLESESNVLERIPDMDKLQRQLGGGGAIVWIRSIWRDSGGTDKWPLYEWRCNLCGWEWSSHDYNDRAPCPNCKESVWPYYPRQDTFYYDFEIKYDPTDHRYGDNAKQSEILELSPTITIDRGRCQHFMSWDDPRSVEKYGYDEYPDIRIGTNGALVQTHDPMIALMVNAQRAEDRQYRFVKVIRCTGRVIDTRPDQD